MKKRFSFCSGLEQRAPASSATALHYRDRSGLLTVDVPASGHFIATGTPGAGKSALLRDAEAAVLYPETLASVYRFRSEDIHWNVPCPLPRRSHNRFFFAVDTCRSDSISRYKQIRCQEDGDAQ